MTSSTETFSGLGAPIQIRLTGSKCSASFMYGYSKNGGAFELCDPGAGTSLELEVANGDTLQFTVMGQYIDDFNLTVRNLSDGSAILDTWNASSPDDGSGCM